MSMSFVNELKWRGLVHQTSDAELDRRLAESPTPVYAGFDPTADSLHVGSLLPILALRRAQLAGLRPLALVGGATGMIGDPSGKASERKLLTVEEIEKNAAGIKAQLERFLDFDGPSPATMVNNIDWFRGLGYLEFLRDVGKHFSVNMMLAKESVRARIEDREQGISYTEFSYMLVQAYDFLHLFDAQGCRLQIGGSDQWGNITAGIDLIRRLRGQESFGLTMPLITTASGQKFGKTEKGAVWLDAARSSPYELWQFFLQTDDRDVGRFLRYYTFLDEPTLVALDEQVKAAPEKREAQRVLAREVTTLVHGKAETERAERAAAALFGGDLRDLDERSIAAVFADAPSSDEPRASLDGAGAPLVDVLARTTLSSSKGAARKDIAGGGIYVNNVRVDDVARALGPADLVAGRFVVVRKGKKSYHLLRFV